MPQSQSAKSAALHVSDLPALRKTLRAQRSALPASTQQQHAARATTLLAQLFSTLQIGSQTPLKIASYVAQAGEIDPQTLQTQLSFPDYYLPIVSGKSLQFGSISSPRVLNRFGIPEPQDATPLAASELDAIIMPLVAFDAHGNRLGMGGGFYDRTLARQHCTKRPLLVALAHGLQRVPALPTQPWDIPLDVAVTERETTQFTATFAKRCR